MATGEGHWEGNGGNRWGRPLGRNTGHWGDPHSQKAIGGTHWGRPLGGPTQRCQWGGPLGKATAKANGGGGHRGGMGETTGEDHW